MTWSERKRVEPFRPSLIGRLVEVASKFRDGAAVAEGEAVQQAIAEIVSYHRDTRQRPSTALAASTPVCCQPEVVRSNA